MPAQHEKRPPALASDLVIGNIWRSSLLPAVLSVLRLSCRRVQVGDVQADVEQLSRDQQEFVDRFESGKGWDDDQDGFVSYPEALNMVSDLGVLKRSTDCVWQAFKMMASPTASAAVPCSVLQSKTRLVSSRTGAAVTFPCSMFDPNGDNSVTVEEIAMAVDSQNMIETNDGKVVWQEAMRAGGRTGRSLRFITEVNQWVSIYQNTGSVIQGLMKSKNFKFSADKVCSMYPCPKRIENPLPPEYMAHDTAVI